MVTKMLPVLSSLGCYPLWSRQDRAGVAMYRQELIFWRVEVTCPGSHFEQRPIKMKQISPGHEVVNRPVRGLLKKSLSLFL